MYGVVLRGSGEGGKKEGWFGSMDPTNVAFSLSGSIVLEISNLYIYSSENPSHQEGEQGKKL